MKEKENLIYGDRAKRLMDAAQRLVALYTDWGRPNSAAQWSATLDSIRKTARPPRRRIDAICCDKAFRGGGSEKERG